MNKNIKLYIASKVLGIHKNNLIFGFERTNEMECIATEYILGKPLSKIFQEKYFWNHLFYTNEHTLDPRPSTERVIELILRKHKKDERLTFLDLGTGTGAIIITLLDIFPFSSGVAIDICNEAIKVAKINAQNIKVKDRCTFIRNDWLDNVETKFNILVSNPPYLLENEYKENLKVLQHEPKIALVEPSYLEMYKRIAEKEFLFDEIYLEVPPKRRKVIQDLFDSNRIKKTFLCY